MKGKNTILIATLLSAWLSAGAKWCSTVVNEELSPVAAATVSIRSASSGEIEEVAVTDSEGKVCLSNTFSPDLSLSISCLGYDTKELVYDQLPERIILNSQTSTLEGVTVYADKDQVSQKGGAFVFTPGSLKTEVKYIYDLLKYVPLVQYNNGVFQILGNNETAKIKINGEDPREWSAGLLQALQALPATMVKRVEVSPSSGSQESASSGGGVIDIVLALPDEGILNRVNASMNYVRDFSTGESYWVGWKKEKFSGAAAFSFSQSASHNIRESQYDYTDSNKHVVESTATHSDRQSIKGGVSMSYNLTSFRVAGMSISLQSGHEWSEENSNATVTQDGMTTPTQFSSLNRHPWYVPVIGVSAWYTERPNPKKNLLDIFIGYYHNAQNSYNLYDSYFLNGISESARQDLSLNVNGYTGQVTFRQRFSDSHSLNVGYSLNGYATSREQAYSNESFDGFRYNEMVNALYAEWSANLSSLFSIKVGLRAENLHTWGRQMQNNVDFSNNYFGLYPSFSASLNFPKGQQSLLLNIDRKIDVPNYELLNPYITWQTPTSYYTGNPSLKPSYAWNINLIYAFLNNWVVGVKVNHEPHCRTNYTYYKDGYTVSSSANLGKYNHINAYIEYSKSFWQRLRANLSLAISSSNRDGVIEGVELTNSSTSCYADLKVNFLISPRYQWRIAIAAWYQSPASSLTLDRRSSYNMNAEISKEWRCGVSLKAGCSRIIYQRSPWIYTSESYQSSSRTVYLPLQFSLSAAYSFGNMKVSPQERNVEIR